MIHYHIWFNFRSVVDATEGLSVIQGFLHELHVSGVIARFQLLKNSGSPLKSKLLPFHALIEFQDDAQFGAAFSAQFARGIQTGAHGQVMAQVDEFQIEVFRQIPNFVRAAGSTRVVGRG